MYTAENTTDLPPITTNAFAYQWSVLTVVGGFVCTTGGVNMSTDRQEALKLLQEVAHVQDGSPPPVIYGPFEGDYILAQVDYNGQPYINTANGEKIDALYRAAQEAAELGEYDNEHEAFFELYCDADTDTSADFIDNADEEAV